MNKVEKTILYFIFILTCLIFIEAGVIMCNTNKLVNEYTIKVCGEVFVMPKQDLTRYN